MPRILLSYRREDSSADAGRIADRLREHFGEDHVFIDIDAILPGDDFTQVIESSLKSCDALVAVIGPQWSSAVDREGRRRLERPDDYVRLEIGMALQRNVRVVPALVSGAVMPEAADLPPDLAPLSRRQALEISDARFHHDVDRLIEALEASGARGQVPLRRRVRPAWQWVRRRRLPLIAVLALLAAAAIVPWTLWNGTDLTGPPTTLGPSELGSPGQPRDIRAGRIYALQLDRYGEAYFRLSSAPAETRLVLDARCRKALPCSLNATLSALDGKGRVVQDHAIQQVMHDIGFRSIRRLPARTSDAWQFKLVNETEEVVDYWLTALDATTETRVPLFGGIVPQALAVDTDAAGLLGPGGAAYFSLDLKPGPHVATFDLSPSPRAPQALSGMLAMVDEEAGDEVGVAHIDLYGLSAQTSSPVGVTRGGAHGLRVQNKTGSTLSYVVRITPR